MNKPHKYAALIKAWADGAEIQARNYEGCDWVDLVGGAPSWFPGWQYRIKPKTIKYRNFLWCSLSSLNPSPKHVICVVIEGEQHREPREKWTGFIKWLGDWQGVEV